MTMLTMFSAVLSSLYDYCNHNGIFQGFTFYNWAILSHHVQFIHGFAFYHRGSYCDKDTTEVEIVASLMLNLSVLVICDSLFGVV